ncbi:Trypsin-2 [Orchesella cincta]|uniref:limulus clotting factor C n=1 Tax=Orchesella cincta TaxID=48709 RepID=A0A1D2MKE8_ORCCI|nr:Trypsin-2 [Orchesella cincta]
MLTLVIVQVLLLSATCLTSPVDKQKPRILIPESYIRVHIEEVAQDEGTVGADITTYLPSITERIAADLRNGKVDESATSPNPLQDNVDEDNFPTPLPFLDEPEEEVSTQSLSRETLKPPNFDISKIPGISGMINAKYAPVYAGRQSCRCGVTGERRFSSWNDTKIVNGEPVPIEELPWTVALLRRNWLGLVNDRPYCGGSLINNQYILTASHCVDGMSARGIVVSLHDEDVTSNSETASGSQRIDVDKIIMHPQYSRRTIDNDIALLKLAKPVTLDNVIIPVCLPANNDHSFENFTATAAGWGATKESGSTSNILRKVDVPVISNEVCNTQTKYKGKITDNMLCAGYVEQGGSDSCQGDSGGPLTIMNGERITLIGVVSWGYGKIPSDTQVLAVLDQCLQECITEWLVILNGSSRTPKELNGVKINPNDESDY